MQHVWTDIDQYIESKLIPEDSNLSYALTHTDELGYPDHLAVAANQGMLLQMLIQMNKCQRILELGTFAAYSTIWLARTLDENGYVLTIEGRDTHALVAKDNIEHANLPATIELKVGMASDILKDQIAQNVAAFDFIFIDADKQSYPKYLELCLKLSHSGTIIVLDNVIRAGAILDPDNQKPSITGIRQTFDALYQHPQILSCTALQTIGNKGHDGFAIAIVK